MVFEIYNTIDIFLYMHPLISIAINFVFVVLLAITITFIKNFGGSHG